MGAYVPGKKVKRVLIEQLSLKKTKALISHIVRTKTPHSLLKYPILPLKQKDTRDSCLVRGFWGDIVQSPYFAFGVETDITPENKELFKVVNTQQRYVSRHINMVGYKLNNSHLLLDCLGCY